MEVGPVLPTHTQHILNSSAYECTRVDHEQFGMYVYITSRNRNVHGYNMTKKDVETLVVEHFGVHHKAP
jgi:hypothetical protein